MRKRTIWTEDEIEVLKIIFEKSSWQEIMAAIPNHSHGSVRSAAYNLGLKRYKMTEEELKISKKERMRSYRSTPLGYQRQIESQRRSYTKVGKDRQATYLRELQSNSFFVWRAKRFHSETKITAQFLEDLWNKQGGLCALTGKPLDGKAQLDHIIPLARGGGNELGNLRWVIPQANRAKRELLDDEFLELCKDVVKTLSGN